MSWLPDYGDEFAGCRDRWLDGRCPCCGMPLEAWHWEGEVHEPAAVAEDVMFCGRCIANDHQELAGFLPMLLEALLSRLDLPGWGYGGRKRLTAG